MKLSKSFSIVAVFIRVGRLCAPGRPRLSSPWVWPILVLLLGLTRLAPAQETDWPRKVVLPQAEVTVYQPELEEFSGDRLRARAVVAVKQVTAQAPVFGVVWFASRLEIDREERTARPREISVADVRFPDASGESIGKLKKVLEENVPKWDLTLSLDQLVASMEDIEGIRTGSEKLNNAPPRILFVKRPTVLVSFEGEPILREVEGSKIRAVVNTPFPVAEDPADKRFYLAVGKFWYRANTVKGPWTPVKEAPATIRAALRQVEESGDAGEEADQEEASPPAIVVATQPTELIATNGDPALSPVEGGALLYVNNTENDLLMEVATQQYFVLLSGRWYRSKSLDGPWGFVEPASLPKAFRAIKEDSVVGHLLNHVPGTEQAREAALDTYVPQTATVKRTATTQVSYDGEPKFEKIPGTTLEYATNTPNSVLKSNGRYYTCEQGVWYESAGSSGPWKVATERPAEVAKIPPESPVETVKYVHIYHSTPEVIYVGYTPGYVGARLYGGTVVFGTGFVYRPWVGTVYYPRPVTWGFRAYYSPWGGWTFGVGARYGGFGVTFFHISGPRYRPPYRAGWWGPGGYRPPYYRPPYYRPPGYRPPGYRPPAPPPGRPGVRPPAPPARPTPYRADTRDNIYNRPQNFPNRTDSNLKPAARPAVQPAGVPNDLLSDKAGNVYRPTNKGWQTKDGAGWRDLSSPGAPAAPTQQPTKPGTRPTLGQLPSTPSARPAQSQRPATPSTRPAMPKRQPAVSTPATFDRLNQERRSRERAAQRTRQLNQSRRAAQPARGRATQRRR